MATTIRGKNMNMKKFDRGEAEVTKTERKRVQDSSAPISLRRTVSFICFLFSLLAGLCFLFNSSPAYGAGGDIAWQYGDAKSGKQESKAMAVDSSGNIIITGYQLLSGTDNDFYTVKIKADGSGLAWPAASFDKSGNDDQATAVAVDSSNNIVTSSLFAFLIIVIRLIRFQ